MTPPNDAKAQSLSDWLRFILGKPTTWKDLTGNAAWFYDKMLEMLPKVVALELALRQQTARAEVCVWTYDDTEDSWHTTCGNAFCLNDGKPSDNDMRFCGYCGHPLREVVRPDDFFTKE